MIDNAFLSSIELPALPALARIVGFMLTAPPFSTKLTPRSAKIGFALVLWLATSQPESTSTSRDAWVALTLSELVVGLTLGFMIQIVFSAIDIIGELISNGMGLLFPGTFDPMGRDSSGPMSGLAQLLGIALFISAGGLESSASYLIQSTPLLPYGELPRAEAVRQHSFGLLTQALLLGMTNSIVLWGSLLLANALMLISARLAGGLNLMSSGLPLLLFIGILLVALMLLPTLNSIWSHLPNLYVAPIGKTP